MIAAMEGLAIGVAGHKDDELIAERMVRGMLGVQNGTTPRASER